MPPTLRTLDRVIPRRVFLAVTALGVLAIGYYLVELVQDPVARTHQVDLFAYSVAEHASSTAFPSTKPR